MWAARDIDDAVDVEFAGVDADGVVGADERAVGAGGVDAVALDDRSRSLGVVDRVPRLAELLGAAAGADRGSASR
jgi:hypothetical protein